MNSKILYALYEAIDILAASLELLDTPVKNKPEIKEALLRAINTLHQGARAAYKVEMEESKKK